MKNLYIKYFLTLLVLLLSKITYSQSANPDGSNYSGENIIPTENKAVDCANNNGIAITINATWINNSTYGTSMLANCLPNANFPGAGVGAWTGVGQNGFITYTFSQPIISATVTYSIVNGPNINPVVGPDIGQIVVNGGGNVTLTNVCGAALGLGNVLTCNLIGGNNPYGDVSVTVNSTCPFTTLTLTNVGGTSGWVQGNLCNFLWSPVCSITPPLLSSTSLNNNCPSEFADLTTIAAFNQSPCYNLTWHTGTPASNLNLISTPNNVAAGTYYASFFNQQSNCYSNTTSVIVTINECCIPTASLLSPNEDVNNLSPLTNGPNPLAVRLLQRQFTIIASNVIGIGDNSPNNGVVYHAGNYVELNRGFQAVFGSQFSAYIEGCSDNFVYRNSIEDVNPNQATEKTDVISESSKLQIYPNPSNTFVNIDLGDSKFKNIVITSIDGKMILNRNVNTNSEQIDVSSYSKGLYLITVQTEDEKTIIKKFIKN